MNRYFASLIAIVIVVALGLPLSLGIASLFYGDADAAPTSFVKLVTACLLPLSFAAAIFAYQNPDSFVSWLKDLLVTILRRIPLHRLTTPIQRAFFLFLLTSAALTIGTLGVYYAYRNDEFIKYIVLGRNYGGYDNYILAFYLGFCGVVIGTVGSFFYEQTIGRVVAWIKGG